MEPDHPGGALEEQIGELRSRVRRLEEALRRRGVVLEDEPSTPKTTYADVAQATVVAPPTHVAAAPAPPVAAPSFGYQPHAAPKDGRSLESRIGSQWFNRIGILAILIGVAWFLKFAFDNHWIGPLGRILIGLVAGAALIAWSERFRSGGYAGFSYSLKAVGSGVLYLALWAAFSMYQLIPASAAFAAMILVTAFNGYMAWVQESELLALYAIVGGLSTPLLLSTGGNHEVTLFSYLLILDIAVLVLVVSRPWSRLLFAAYTGTVLIVLGWWSADYTESQLARTVFFVCCFFLIFAIAPRLVRIEMKEGESPAGWNALALAVLPVANASLGFLAFFALFDHASTAWVMPWIAVLFAGFYLLLLRLPEHGRLKASPPILSSLHLAAAVVFLTIKIPLKAEGRLLTIGWVVEGAALLWVANRTHSRLLLTLSLACLALGLFTLILVSPTASATPLFNTRFATYCVAIAVFAFVAWLALEAPAEDAEDHAFAWPALAGAAVLVVNALILLAVSLEIHSFWSPIEMQGNFTRYREYNMYAEFTYSAWFMLFGAILLIVGFVRRSAFMRWQALVLLAVSIAKVFLVDVSELSQGFRIVSFLGLGALLLGVSFVYQRDWLNLHGIDRRDA